MSRHKPMAKKKTETLMLYQIFLLLPPNVQKDDQIEMLMLNHVTILHYNAFLRFLKLWMLPEKTNYEFYETITFKYNSKIEIFSFRSLCIIISFA